MCDKCGIVNCNCSWLGMGREALIEDKVKKKYWEECRTNVVRLQLLMPDSDLRYINTYIKNYGKDYNKITGDAKLYD